jgi:hypothetical protein
VDEQPAEPVVEPALTEAQIAGLGPGLTFVRVVRAPRRWPGLLSCILAVLMLAATGAGIQVASTGDYTVSTTLAYLAVALSAAALLFGLISIAKRWARGAGIVGAIVAVAGNPLVLLYVLKSLSGS